MKQINAIACTVAIVLGGACDRGQTPAIENRQPFSQAVETYLRKKYMDLAIGEYKQLRLTESGTKAEAIIGMTHAAEGARVQARFRFFFEKTGNRWQVVGHEPFK